MVVTAPKANQAQIETERPAPLPAFFVCSLIGSLSSTQPWNVSGASFLPASPRPVGVAITLRELRAFLAWRRGARAVRCGYPAGTAPVSQKRVGLKRLARAAMEFALASFGSVRRVCCRFDDPERRRRGARSDFVGLRLAIDGKRCPTTLQNSIDSGWPLGRPVPRHQFVDAFLRPAIHQTRQQVSEICLGIGAIQLAGLN
jgi:hypothetical protein